MIGFPLPGVPIFPRRASVERKVSTAVLRDDEPSPGPPGSAESLSSPPAAPNGPGRDIARAELWASTDRSAEQRLGTPVEVGNSSEHSCLHPDVYPRRQVYSHILPSASAAVLLQRRRRAVRRALWNGA